MIADARLRPMRWWDVAEAMPIEQVVFAAQPWTEAGFWSELAGIPATRYYVVAGVPSATVVGYAGVAVAGGEADIQTLAVAPAHQGRGLGRHLLDDLLREARTRSCSQVMLEVRAGDSPARRLYDRTGFEQLAVRRGYYGPGLDAVVMRLRLGAS